MDGRDCVVLGMVLVRRVVEVVGTVDNRLVPAFPAVAGVVERRDALEDFFCNVDDVIESRGFVMDDNEGFLRSCSLEGACLSCD